MFFKAGGAPCRCGGFSGKSKCFSLRVPAVPCAPRKSASHHGCAPRPHKSASHSGYTPQPRKLASHRGSASRTGPLHDLPPHSGGIRSAAAYLPRVSGAGFRAKRYFYSLGAFKGAAAPLTRLWALSSREESASPAGETCPKPALPARRRGKIKQARVEKMGPPEQTGTPGLRGIKKKR